MAARKLKRMTKQEELHSIARAARKASSTAVRVSRVLDLPMKFVVGNNIVVEESDGTKRKIKALKEVKSKVTLSKGTKICIIPKKD
ncbi:hypothetical protein [Elizabethkingia ursingii]|uniref:hypothetical protein n=1 Tax=Elizabethkingia ursingii TaxID=1756150 RepID=UPI000750B067|nr:hypothetical protein [Elizabethkingia ursingii]KUY29807.1 hypothetical protein ATB96_17765 [Elizabethkingia ursingii]